MRPEYAHTHLSCLTPQVVEKAPISYLPHTQAVELLIHA